MLSASAVVDCSVCRSKLNIIIRGMIKMVEMVSLWKLEQMLDKYLAYKRTQVAVRRSKRGTWYHRYVLLRTRRRMLNG